MPLSPTAPPFTSTYIPASTTTTAILTEATTTLPSSTTTDEKTGRDTYIAAGAEDTSISSVNSGSDGGSTGSTVRVSLSRSKFVATDDVNADVMLS